ncbi:MAG: TonB-dependent receptor [Bacteroidales bacterium]|nr:TonB-dependent receptor [Bacteroidales bacterium]
MKVSFSLLILGILHVAGSYGQDVKLTINERDIELGALLTLIEKQSGFSFFYNNDRIDKSTKVSIRAREENIVEVLEKVLPGIGIDFSIRNKTDIILRSREEAHDKVAGKTNKVRQDITVTGTVSDGKGELLPGVNVVVRGVGSGTTTNDNGEFTITVPSDTCLLQFSFVGFRMERVIVGNRRIFAVTLSEMPTDLDEVVIVGYGTQRKESVIGAIAAVKPAKLQTNQSRALSNAMAGLIPGIISVQRSGELGYDQSEFYIRGMSTFSEGSRTPLVLVDGIERNMDNISPEEIESFSVLKDAAATAIYGVRGANGAILIKTKRGTVGKPQISVKADYGITMPTKMPEFVDGVKYMEIFNEASVLSGASRGPFSPTAIEYTGTQVDPDLYPNVNWVDEVMKKSASNQKITVDVAGGTERLRYRFITSVYNEAGMTVYDKDVSWDGKYKYRRYTVRSNVDMNLTPSTDLTFSVGGFVTDRNTPGGDGGSGIVARAMQTPPVVYPVKYSTGEFAQVQNSMNPWVWATQTGYQRQDNNGLQSLVTVNQNVGQLWEPLNGLQVKATFSFDVYSYHNVQRYKYPATWMASGRDAQGNLILTNTNKGDEFLGFGKAAGGNRRMYFELPVNYDRTFGSHAVGAMLLFNRDSYIDADAGDPVAAFPYRHQGVAGRFTYNYGFKYFVEANFGYNGSENFASDLRYGFFPSFALGWMISNEKFMENIQGTVSKLKIRGSWGKVGNDNIGGRRFAYVGTINTTSGYSFGYTANNSYSGFREGDANVDALSWEIADKTDAGIELGLWNVLNVTVDMFIDNRSNIFLRRKTITELTGYSNMPWANIGEVDNKGFEASVDYFKSFGKDFSISFMGNFTFTTNKVINDDEPSDILGTNRSRTGNPLNVPMLQVAERLLTVDDFIDPANGILKPEIPSQFGLRVFPGDILYRDVNGDTNVTAEDETQMGNPTLPAIIYGFGLTVQYKKFDMGIMFQGAGKTSMVLEVSGTNNYFIPGSGGRSTGNILSNVDDRWTEDHPRQDVFWPRLGTTNAGINNRASTWWQKDARFIRLKNLEIGYTPVKNETAAFKSIRMFFRGSNLFVWSPFKLWDPELGGDGYRKYPMTKYMSFGLEVNF